MHIWILLATREASLLATLMLLGAGPASFLSERFDAGSRIALTPVLGFCLGTCVTTTLIQFTGTNHTFWVLIPLALASVTVAAVRTHRAEAPSWHQRLPVSDIVALLVVVLAVAGPVTYTLHLRRSVGPAVYYYSDADNYVALQDAARTTSLHAARVAWQHHLLTGARWGDFTQLVLSSIAAIGSNLDATPLDSNVNALLGLSASATYSPFLIVLLLSGALGAFAAVRYLSSSRTPTAVLAGALFGGPMFLELWFDSFQAAIVAIGLLMPFVILCHDALRKLQLATLLLISLIGATMLSVYPLYVVFLAGIAGLMLLWQLWVNRRSVQRPRLSLAAAVAGVATVCGATVLFDLVGFIRDIRYYQAVLNGSLALPRVLFHLPLSVLPGWIAQTREFWDMPSLVHADVKQLILGGVLPLIFLTFVLAGLRRYRAALALVVLAALCSIIAEYSFASREACTYCAERNLLPLTPIATVLIALGLCALLSASVRWVKIAGLVGVALVVLAVGQRTRVELTRFADASYFMGFAERSVLSRAPSAGASIEEEGFGFSVAGEPEQPLTYHLINEHAPGAASVILGSDAGNSIAYLNLTGLTMFPGPEFHQDYRYVLTRLGGVATDRRLIARTHGIALEERVKPLDITPYAGLAVPLERVSTSGVPWVQTQYPLQFYVVGYDDGKPAWASLTFRTSVPVSVPAQPGVSTREAGDIFRACVRATGREPIRRVALQLYAALTPGPAPHVLFPPPMPLEGVAMTSMRVVTDHCTP